jgi:hypothetical protein
MIMATIGELIGRASQTNGNGVTITTRNGKVMAPSAYAQLSAYWLKRENVADENPEIAVGSFSTDPIKKERIPPIVELKLIPNDAISLSDQNTLVRRLKKEYRGPSSANHAVVIRMVVQQREDKAVRIHIGRPRFFRTDAYLNISEQKMPYFGDVASAFKNTMGRLNRIRNAVASGKKSRRQKVRFAQLAAADLFNGRHIAELPVTRAASAAPKIPNKRPGKTRVVQNWLSGVPVVELTSRPLTP